MRRIIYGLLGLTGIVLVAGLSFPLFINVNDYKPQIMAKARNALGREIGIDGKLSVSLLPTPEISVDHVRIGNLPGGGAKNMLQVKRLRVFVHLWPLLSKQIKIKTVQLEQPEVYLEKLKDGRVNWSFFPKDNIPDSVTVNHGKDKSNPPENSAFGVAIDRIHVNKGHIIYVDNSHSRKSAPVEIKDINLDAAIDLLKGVYSVEGDFKSFDRTLKIKGKVSAEGIAHNVDLAMDINRAVFSVKGQASVLEQTFKGQLDAFGHLQHLVNPSATTIVLPILTQPFKLNAQVNYDSHELSINQAHMQLGSATSQAAVKVAFGDAMNVEGRIDNLPGGGMCQFTLSAVNSLFEGSLKGQLGRLQEMLIWAGIEAEKIPPELANIFVFSTNYSFDDIVHFKNINLLLKDAQLYGDVIYKQPSSLTVNLVTPQGENIIRLLGMEVPGTLGKGRIVGNVQGDETRLGFDVTTFLETTSLHTKGVVQSLKDNPRFDIAVEGQSPHLSALLKGLGLPFGSSYNNTKIQGKIKGDLADVNIDTHLDLDRLVLKFKGGVASYLSAPEFNMELFVFHPHLKNFLGGMGHGSDISSDALSLNTRIEGNTNRLFIKNIKGKIGKTGEISGMVKLDRSGKKPDIQINIATTEVDLGTLLTMNVPFAQPLPEARIYLIGGLAGGEKAASHHTPWPHEPLDLAFLDDFDAHIQFSTPKFIYNDISVSRGKLVVNNQNGRLDIASFTGSVYDGDFNVTGHVTSKNAAQIEATLKNANMKNIFVHQKGIHIIAGNLSLSTTLKTQGKSVYQMVSNLEGPLSVNAQNGIIDGFDLQALSRKLASLKNIQSLLGLFNTSMTGGQTPFSSFKGDVIFKKGMGTIQTMTLVAKGGEGTAQGQFNLPQYTMNINSEIHLTDNPGLPPFRMHLTGAMDNPSRQLDTSGLQKYMMDNVFKGVFEQLGKGALKPAEILGSLLGGNKSSSPDDTNNPVPQKQDQNQSQKPEQIVKGMLKGLFK